MSTFRGFAGRLLTMGRLLAVKIGVRLGMQTGKVLARTLPRVFLNRAAVVGGGSALRRAPGVLARLIGRTGSSHVRALAMGVWTRSNILQRHRHTMHAPKRFPVPPSDLHVDVLRIIRDAQQRSTKSAEATTVIYPQDYNAYELGSNIAVGCCGAVYEARLKEPLPKTGRNPPSIDKPSYPLVMKLLFNYDYTSSATGVWRQHEQECVPTIDERVKGRMNWCRALKKEHFNVAPILTSFVDIMPILKDARALYAEAISPVIDSYHYAMFVVMRRYSMTLRQYVLTTENDLRDASTLTIRNVLLAQLLEGVHYLSTQHVSHRDFKSDNILLDMDDLLDTPRLLVTDFGCCLANKRNETDMKMFYESGHDLGGNASLRPPEIHAQARAVDRYDDETHNSSKPSSFLHRPPNRIDFATADLWAAATLAHEIYTGVNPFYTKLSSEMYSEEEVPSLPEEVPEPIKQMVGRALSRDPKDRPSTDISATSVMLCLLRSFPNIASTLTSLRTSHLTNERKDMRSMLPLQSLISLYACETITGARSILCDVEVKMRNSFMCRVDDREIGEALTMFFMPTIRAEPDMQGRLEDGLL